MFGELFLMPLLFADGQLDALTVVFRVQTNLHCATNYGYIITDQKAGGRVSGTCEGRLTVDMSEKGPRFPISTADIRLLRLNRLS